MLDISRLIEQVAGGRSAKNTVDSFLREAEEAASTAFQDPKGMKMAIKGAPESMPLSSAPSDGEDLRGEETSGESPLSRKIESFLRLFEEEEELEEMEDEDALEEEKDDEDLEEDDDSEKDPKSLEEAEDDDEELEEEEDDEKSDSEDEDDEEDNEPKSSDGDEITESTVSKFQTGQEVSYVGKEYDHLTGVGTVLIDVPHASGIMYVVEWQHSGTVLVPESDLK